MPICTRLKKLNKIVLRVTDIGYCKVHYGSKTNRFQIKVDIVALGREERMLKTVDGSNHWMDIVQI